MRIAVVGRAAVIGGVIPVVKRSQGEENSRPGGVHPGEIGEGVALALHIANATGFLGGGIGDLEIIRA